MNEGTKFQDLDWGNRLLTMGYVTGCVSSLLVGLGSVIRLMGSLPPAPISYGVGVGTPTSNGATQTKGSYWDK